MSPLLNLLVSQPKLLAGHAMAYAQLASSEAAEFSTLCKRRLVLSACALCFATLSIGLAGVAWMLWYVSPVAQHGIPWPLIIVPVIPALGLAWCLAQLSAKSNPQGFEKTRQQLAADTLLFKEGLQP